MTHKEMFDARMDEWRFRHAVPDDPLFMTGLARYKHFDPSKISLSSGDSLKLVRRPDNPDDPNAVEVFTAPGRKSIGFLPREVAGVISPALDAGEDLGARFHAESDVASGMVVVHGDALSPLLGALQAVSDEPDSDTPLYIKGRTEDINVDWYDRNAVRYSEGADKCNPRSDMSAFLSTLRPGARILDAGCGNGRDMLEMLNQGFRVEGFDASAEMCRLAQEKTGVAPRHMRFSEYEDAPDSWDGIWAMASLVHVSPEDLPDVVNALRSSLKPGGTLFAALKAGDVSDVAPDGRRMMRVNEEMVKEAFCGGGELMVSRRNIRTSSGAMDDWINVIYCKAPEPELRIEV